MKNLEISAKTKAKEDTLADYNDALDQILTTPALCAEFRSELACQKIATSAGVQATLQKFAEKRIAQLKNNDNGAKHCAAPVAEEKRASETFLRFLKRNSPKQISRRRSIDYISPSEIEWGNRQPQKQEIECDIQDPQCQRTTTHLERRQSAESYNQSKAEPTASSSNFKSAHFRRAVLLTSDAQSRYQRRQDNIPYNMMVQQPSKIMLDRKSCRNKEFAASCPANMNNDSSQCNIFYKFNASVTKLDWSGTPTLKTKKPSLEQHLESLPGRRGSILSSCGSELQKMFEDASCDGVSVFSCVSSVADFLAKMSKSDGCEGLETIAKIYATQKCFRRESTLVMSHTALNPSGVCDSEVDPSVKGVTSLLETWEDPEDAISLSSINENEFFSHEQTVVPNQGLLRVWTAAFDTQHCSREVRFHDERDETFATSGVRKYLEEKPASPQDNPLYSSPQDAVGVNKDEKSSVLQSSFLNLLFRRPKKVFSFDSSSDRTPEFDTCESLKMSEGESDFSHKSEKTNKTGATESLGDSLLVEWDYEYCSESGSCSEEEESMDSLALDDIFDESLREGS